MDTVKLKIHAELLEQAIQENIGKSEAVDWLAEYRPLLKAISDAKAARIDEPYDLGLGRWEMESNIQETRDVSHRLAEFELLLGGWGLPSENGT